jgi:hypothetical protein
MNNLYINISEKYGPERNQVELVKKFLKYEPKYVAELERSIDDIRTRDPVICKNRFLGTKVVHSVPIGDFRDKLKINFIKDT